MPVAAPAAAAFPRMDTDGYTLRDSPNSYIRVRIDGEGDHDARYKVAPEGTPGAERVRGPTDKPVWVVVDRDASIEANRRNIESPYSSTLERMVDRVDIARHRFHKLFGN